MKRKILVGLSLVAITIASLQAACNSDISLGDKKIITSATDFADNELVTRSYVAKMIETHMKEIGNTVEITNSDGDVEESFGVIYYNGRAWLDRNLGATAVATSWDDNRTEVLGDLYQWGRPRGEHSKRDSAVFNECAGLQETDNTHYFFKPTDDGLDWLSKETGNCNAGLKRFSLWQSAKDPYEDITDQHNVCPKGWSVPTLDDFRSLDIENAEDAFNKIKLVAAGYRSPFNGNIGGLTRMYYWTSTVSKINAQYHPYVLRVEAEYSKILPERRYWGFSVRCVKHLK